MVRSQVFNFLFFLLAFFLFSPVAAEDGGRLFLEAGKADVMGKKDDALALYFRAADQGSWEANHLLCVLYDDGVLPASYSRDFDLASRLKRGAAAGHADSAFFLGKIHLYGRKKVKADPAAARKWFEAAAKRGHAGASLALEDMAEKEFARSIRENDELRWLTKAAEGSDFDASSKLGRAFEFGRFGLSKDSKRAAAYYEKGAKAGHVPSMQALGGLYARMNEQSLAAYWLEQAALRGDVESARTLASLHLNGTGDFISAYVWYGFSLRALFPDAKDLPAVSDDYARLEKILTDSEKAESAERTRVLSEEMGGYAR